MQFQVRDVIDGQYKVLERHQGGMSLVYIVLDEFSQKKFAVKTVKEEELADRGAVKRFSLEARTWLNLDQHDNIVQAMIYREIEGQPFLFLEYVDGTDLHKLLDQEKRLYLPQALDFAVQVCAGMEYVQSKDVGTGDRGVVHRDIKPGNIMITRHRVAKVTDFGLAKVHGVRTRLTATGVGMGTYLYMPPEQFLDASSADKTTDIYSFGVVLYQMVTGEVPTTGKNVGNLIHNIMNREPAPASKLNPAVPEALDKIILRCLAKRREDRFPSFGRLGFELNLVRHELEPKVGEDKEARQCIQCGYLTTSQADSCYLCAGELRPIGDVEAVQIRAGVPRMGPGASAVETETPTVIVSQGPDAVTEAQEHFDRGMTHLKEGKLEDARSALERSVAIQPDRQDAVAALEQVKEALERARAKARTTPAYNWPMFRSNIARTGYTPEVIVPPLVQRWQFPAGEWVFAAPAVSNGVLYVGARVEERGQFGRFCAVDARSGTLRWEYFTGYEVNSPPAVVEGNIVLVGIMRSVVALEAGTGRRIWEARTGDIVDSSPLCWEQTVYVGSADGKLYALDLHTGKQRWTAQTELEIHGSAAVWDNTVYVGSYDHKVYAFEAGTGEKLWEFMTGDEVTSTPAYAGGTVYVGSCDHRLYALDGKTGVKRWEFQTGAEIFSSPAVWDGAVYFGSRDRRVYALDALTGEKRWEAETGDWVYSSPAISGGVIYVGSHDHHVYAIEIETGTKVWEYETGGEVRSSPVISQGMLFVGSNDGSVYAFSPA